MGRHRRHDDRGARLPADRRRPGGIVPPPGREAERRDEPGPHGHRDVCPLAGQSQPLVRRPAAHRRLRLGARHVHHDHRLLRADRAWPASGTTTSPTSIARPICGRTWPPAAAIRSPAGSGTFAAGRSSRRGRRCARWRRCVVDGAEGGRGKGEGGTSDAETADRRIADRASKIARDADADACAALDDQTCRALLQQAACRLRTVARRRHGLDRTRLPGGQSVEFLATGAAFIPHPSSLIPHSLDVPAMGFAWVGPERRTRRRRPNGRAGLAERKPTEPPPLAEDERAAQRVLRGPLRSAHRRHSLDLRLPQPRSPAGPADRPAAAPRRRAGGRRQLLDHGGRRNRRHFGRTGAGRDRLPRPADGPRRPPRGRIPADDPRVARQPRHRDSRSSWTSTASPAPIRGIRTTPPASPGKTRRPASTAA